MPARGGACLPGKDFTVLTTCKTCRSLELRQCLTLPLRTACVLLIFCLCLDLMVGPWRWKGAPLDLCVSLPMVVTLNRSPFLCFPASPITSFFNWPIEDRYLNRGRWAAFRLSVCPNSGNKLPTLLHAPLFPALCPATQNNTTLLGYEASPDSVSVPSHSNFMALRYLIVEDPQTN